MPGKPSKIGRRGAVGGMGVLAVSLGCDRPATAPPADLGTPSLRSAAARIAPLHQRMRPPGPTDWLVATHETAHMLGIPHCIAYECGMNGSNSLDEADSRPMGFCPECEQKVWWATGADPAHRYRSLAKFAGARGLVAEAGFWKASLDAVAGK